MKGRKTVNVEGMLQWANKQLARTDEYATQSFKAGISHMIEKVLTESNNYNGFGYLTAGDWEKGIEYNRYYYGS